MGLTPMDLFNDILTNENDLRNFLQQSDVKNVSSSSPGIIIQGNTFTKHADNHLWRPCSAYLAFVKKINGNFLDPILAPFNNNNTERIRTLEETLIEHIQAEEQIETIENIDNPIEPSFNIYDDDDDEDDDDKDSADGNF